MSTRFLTTFFAALLFLLALYAEPVNADPPERLNEIISELIQLLEEKNYEKVVVNYMQSRSELDRDRKMKKFGKPSSTGARYKTSSRKPFRFRTSGRSRVLVLETGVDTAGGSDNGSDTESDEPEVTVNDSRRLVETDKIRAYWEERGPDLLGALKTIVSTNIESKIKDYGAYTAAAYVIPDPDDGGLELVVFVHSQRSNGDERWWLHSFRYPVKPISGSEGE